MSELVPVRAFVVDDDPGKIVDLQEGFELAGSLVVITADRGFGVKDLVDAQQITPDTIDVAVVDSDFGHGPGGGLEIVRFLGSRGLIRDRSDTEPRSDRIVVVGSSIDTDWAEQVGSLSHNTQTPLMVDWKIRPLNLAALVEEVRYLKPKS
jgi:hypothetical protein